MGSAGGRPFILWQAAQLARPIAAELLPLRLDLHVLLPQLLAECDRLAARDDGAQHEVAEQEAVRLVLGELSAAIGAERLLAVLRERVLHPEDHVLYELVRDLSAQYGRLQSRGARTAALASDNRLRALLERLEAQSSCEGQPGTILLSGLVGWDGLRQGSRTCSRLRHRCRITWSHTHTSPSWRMPSSFDRVQSSSYT